MNATITYRICYEDTDAGGVVYYGNYLRYLERGRNEYLRERGQSVREFHDAGILFPVVGVHLRYRAPARYDDVITVETWIEAMTRASVTFGHRVTLQETERTLVEGKVKVACVDGAMKPRRLPVELLDSLPPGPGEGEPHGAESVKP